MKTTLITIILTISSSLAFSHEDNTTKIQELETRIVQLEKLLKDDSSSSAQELKKIKTPEKGDSLLILKNWSYKLEKGRHSSNYNIKYSLSNGYKKNIKLLDASIHFSDLLGEHLYGIKITPDLKIKVGELKADGGIYGINRFMNEQARMAKMDKKDIVAKLVIRKIVFDDNTILEL